MDNGDINLRLLALLFETKASRRELVCMEFFGEQDVHTLEYHEEGQYKYGNEVVYEKTEYLLRNHGSVKQDYQYDKDYRYDCHKDGERNIVEQLLKKIAAQSI